MDSCCVAFLQVRASASSRLSTEDDCFRGDSWAIRRATTTVGRSQPKPSHEYRNRPDEWHGIKRAIQNVQPIR